MQPHQVYSGAIYICSLLYSKVPISKLEVHEIWTCTVLLKDRVQILLIILTMVYHKLPRLFILIQEDMQYTVSLKYIGQLSICHALEFTSKFAVYGTVAVVRLCILIHAV